MQATTHPAPKPTLDGELALLPLMESDPLPAPQPLVDAQTLAFTGRHGGAPVDLKRALTVGLAYTFGIGAIAGGAALAGVWISLFVGFGLEIMDLLKDAYFSAFVRDFGVLGAMLGGAIGAVHFARQSATLTRRRLHSAPEDAAFQVTHRLSQLPNARVGLEAHSRRHADDPALPTRCFYTVTHDDGTTHHLTLTDDGERCALAYAAPATQVSLHRVNAALRSDRVRRRLKAEGIDPNTLHAQTETKRPGSTPYTTLRLQPMRHTGAHRVTPKAAQVGPEHITIPPETVYVGASDAPLTLAIIAEALCTHPTAELRLRDAATASTPALREDATQTWQLRADDHDSAGAFTSPTGSSTAHLGALLRYLMITLTVIALGAYGAYQIWGATSQLIAIVWCLLWAGITSPVHGGFARASPPRIAPRQTRAPAYTTAPAALTLSEGRLRLGDAEIDLSAPFQTHLTRAPGSDGDAQTTLGVTLTQGRAKIALRVPNTHIPDHANLPPLELDAPELDPDDAQHLWDHVRAWASTHSVPPRWALASTAPLSAHAHPQPQAHVETARVSVS